MSLVVLLDAGYGDNGKGKIANEWARRGWAEVVIDGGVGPSAAHRVDLGNAEVWYSQVPSGWLGPATELFVGPGVLVDAELLLDELAALHRFGVQERLRLDPRCGLLSAVHRAADVERHFEGGCATGRAEQMLGRLSTAAEVAALTDYLVDVPRALASAMDAGRTVLVSGSHGHGYDPYRTARRASATSEPCGSAAALSRSGIGAARSPRVIGVVGAVTTTVLPDVELESELSLDEIEARGMLSYGRVSGLRRRVAMSPQWRVLEDFVALERPAGLVLGRTDLWDPSCRGGATPDHLTPRVRTLIARIEQRTGTPVIGVSTGPRTEDYVELTCDWGEAA